MGAQLNQFSSLVQLTGSSMPNQYGVDFGFTATKVEMFYETSGPTLGYSLQSSVASTGGPFITSLQQRTMDLLGGVNKIGLCSLSTTTSTAAAVAPLLRVNAWG